MVLVTASPGQSPASVAPQGLVSLEDVIEELLGGRR